LEDDHARRHQHDQAGDQQSDRAQIPFGIVRQKFGQGQDDDQLDQLRRLKGHPAEPQPALGSVDLHTDQEHHAQHQHRQTVQDPDVVQDDAVVHPQHRHKQQHPQAEAHQMLLQVG